MKVFKKQWTASIHQAQLCVFIVIIYFLFELFNIKIILIRGSQFSKSFRSCLKILGARRVTSSKFCNEGPQVLFATLHNLRFQASLNLEFCAPVLNAWYDQPQKWAFKQNDLQL